MYRVDPKRLSSEDISQLAGAKYFSGLRQGKTVKSSVAKVKMPRNFEFISSEEVVMICLRQEEALRLFAKVLVLE